MTFQPTYFYTTLILFIAEVCIALFVHDLIIRPFVGDVLVVILIYCFIRTFWRVQATAAIASVFLFACIVEGLQYLNLINNLGLQSNRFLVVLLGTTFDWKDIGAYALGAAIVWLWENRHYYIK